MNTWRRMTEKAAEDGLRPFHRKAVYRDGTRLPWSVEFHAERPADQAEAWGHWTWEDASHEH